MSAFDLSALRALPAPLARELRIAHDVELALLLPVLGPLFSLGLVLFNVWDYLIDPLHAFIALPVRCAFAAVGALAYLPTGWHWTPVQRCGFLYATHACAITLCAFLLTGGLQYGVAGICATVFTISVVALSLRTFALIIAAPSLLFVALCALDLAPLGFINNVMLYLLSVSLAAIVMLAMRVSRQKAFMLEKKLLGLARHDSLTGSFNRAYLTELAEREVALSLRHGRPLAAAMLDIDHFKHVNDDYGHDVGDQVIALLAATCEDNLRVIDHFGRIGGEEFVCVLPETNEADALLCAERLRGAIEALRLATPRGTLQFTVSVGVAVLAPAHASWAALLKDADTALYHAKRTGRNRVALAGAAAAAGPQGGPAAMTS